MVQNESILATSEMPARKRRMTPMTITARAKSANFCTITSPLSMMNFVVGVFDFGFGICGDVVAIFALVEGLR